MLGKANSPVQPTEATTASAPAEPYLRPAELVYAVDEIPPPLRLVLISLQYAIMTAIYLIIVAIILRHATPPTGDSVGMMGIACIALAFGTALQKPRPFAGLRDFLHSLAADRKMARDRNGRIMVRLSYAA